MSDLPALPPSGENAEHWYSPPRLWAKLRRIARFTGEKTLLTALTLFYCLRDADTPAWAKRSFAAMTASKRSSLQSTSIWA